MMKSVYNNRSIDLIKVQTPITGSIGALILVAGTLLFAILRYWKTLFPYFQYRHIILSLIAFLAMMAIEFFFIKVYRRNFDFTSPRLIESLQWKNIKKKFISLCITLLSGWFLYWLFSEYGLKIDFKHKAFVKTWYSPFFVLYSVLTVCYIALSPFYFYLTEKYRKWDEEEDEYLQLFKGYMDLLKLRKPEDEFFNAIKGLCVKFFFTPLMVTFFANSCFIFENKILFLIKTDFNIIANPVFFYSSLYECLYEGIFYVDLAFTVVGYNFCLKLFDTNIKSAEPTLFGWFVCLMCYKPFFPLVTFRYLNYSEGDVAWGSVLWNNPYVYPVVGLIILALLFVYTWSTIMFGLRFSNLTNRGIISRGPYAVIRHPAYLTKNISWWLIFVPFLISFQNVIQMLIINLIYYYRAITEEKHLKQDPHYLEYMKKVPYRFIPGIF